MKVTKYIIISTLILASTVLAWPRNINAMANHQNLNPQGWWKRLVSPRNTAPSTEATKMTTGEPQLPEGKTKPGQDPKKPSTKNAKAVAGGLLAGGVVTALAVKAAVLAGGVGLAVGVASDKKDNPDPKVKEVPTAA